MSIIIQILRCHDSCEKSNARIAPAQKILFRGTGNIGYMIKRREDGMLIDIRIFIVTI
jgi:hypothetical protein